MSTNKPDHVRQLMEHHGFLAPPEPALTPELAERRRNALAAEMAPHDAAFLEPGAEAMAKRLRLPYRKPVTVGDDARGQHGDD